VQALPWKTVTRRAQSGRDCHFLVFSFHFDLSVAVTVQRKNPDQLARLLVASWGDQWV